MRAAGILELAEVAFLEPGYSALTDDLYTGMLLGIPAVEGRLLIDPGENPLAIAVSDGKQWYAASFLHRALPREAIEFCEELDCGIYEEERPAWEAAVREYYSLLLAGTTTPAIEDLPPGRPDKLRSLFEEVWGKGAGQVCLDCCCGSGAGSAAARAFGMLPLSYDNDPALLALGLSTGRLLPPETLWIDGARAGEYLDHVPRGMAAMMGAIDNFTADMWEGIAAEMLALVDEALITVGTEGEARKVAEWCRSAGHRADVAENPRDPFYDRWICRTERGR